MSLPPKHIVTAAAIVLDRENRILLLNGPKRGWEMPGGHVEEGESLASAAVRETKEETGIDIEIVRFCGMYQNVKDSVCSTLFLARPVGGEFQTSAESQEIGYFSVEEALDRITWPIFKDQIRSCLNRDEPFLVEFNA
ncbi:NUDIX hydrolase [Paenibacillus flagellatus]|uniref:ADP-ribose pyrophosphatase n=1 Tax=Paenibacillus flagellatus TaxID=2211139 RepID=A0A2V5KRZ8_9BACL|nr:NUDIX hydrolase [Paenibacillus flagellatus]PYI54287.1 ADP-ribose pyrophosphatase [Paenibacillus flagellatus]